MRSLGVGSNGHRLAYTSVKAHRACCTSKMALKHGMHYYLIILLNVLAAQ